MTPDEINDEQTKQNTAFKHWLDTDVDYRTLSKLSKQFLCDYVGGLAAEIADLKRDKYRQ